jgi:hypothetical protein
MNLKKPDVIPHLLFLYADCKVVALCPLWIKE